MDLRNAAGRNWASDRPKRRPNRSKAASGPMRLPETLPPPGQLEHRDAAGRNWARERPKRRAVRLTTPAERPYPLREMGAGDHDAPYRSQSPSAAWTFPFTALQFGRLLALRGRLLDGALTDDRIPTVDDLATLGLLHRAPTEGQHVAPNVATPRP